MSDTVNGSSEYDLSYLLESADGRLANACPFTEDIEPERTGTDTGSTFICERCGGVFHKKSGGWVWVQKYCHPCAAERAKERSRERYRNRYSKPLHKKERVYPAEAFAALADAARGLGIRVSEPANRKGNSIEEINRLAAEAGMSYGQYVAMKGR